MRHKINKSLKYKLFPPSALGESKTRKKVKHGN